MFRPSWPSALVLSLILLPLSGCLITRTHPPTVRISTATLRDATLEELVGAIDSEATRLQTFIANVDIDFSAGGKKKGRVTDYAELSGYILVRKPEMLRMKVQFPLVRNTALDMVSNGKTFEVSVPPKNEFFVGSNQIGKPAAQPLENLRPQHIMDALLLRPINPENEIPVLQQGTETVKDPKTHNDAEQANYEVLVIAQDRAGAYLSRKIVFSRVDLQPHAQYVYDRHGQLVTYARYENFSDHGGVMFPGAIDIQRPVEEYEFKLYITQLRVNEPIADDQFVVPQPPGSKLIDLDQRNASANTRVETQNAARSPQ
jgi:Domain of unknown function (DUF4292)